MATWYPQDIRTKIHEISNKFPDGFVHKDSSMSGMALAERELNRYKLRRIGVGKMRLALFKRRRKSNHQPTMFSTTLDMLRIGRETDLKSKKAGLVDIADDTKTEDVKGHHSEEGNSLNSIREDSVQSTNGQSRRGSSRRRLTQELRSSAAKLFAPLKPVRRSSST